MTRRQADTPVAGPAGHANVDRRTFLRVAGLGGVALSGLLAAACGPGVPQAGRAPTAGAAPTPLAPSTPKPSSRSVLPTYAPIEAAKPDLPSTPEGLDAGYLTFPKNLVRSVTQTPGTGADVSVFTLVQGAAPPAIDQNPAWQAVNKELNANVKMVMVPRPDYPTKVATTMAGGDLPDLFTLYLLALSIGNIPDFLKASYADLTPYLAGDAIKDYPNLAAIPTLPWKQTVFNGGIYGVPIPRPYFQYVWYINQSQLDEIGGTQPRSADDFKRLLQQMTRPNLGQWGIAQTPAEAFGLTLTPLLSMFKAPNNWAVDRQGKFTKDFETEEFRAALGYVRDLYAAGLFHPDSPSLNSTTVKSHFVSGKAGIISTGWFSYAGEFWNVGLRQNPPITFRTLRPFSHDGSPSMWHQYQGFVGMTSIKKGSPERIRELLRIMNYVAAPFGSQEALLLEYGIEGTDFTYDTRGNPLLTDRGLADTSVSWRYLTMRPQVLFNPTDPEYVRVAYADEQAMVQNMVTDPSLGLFSGANSSKGTVIFQKFTEGVAGIVAGRDPLSLLDQLIRDWRAAGGDQIRGEFEQAYAEAMR